MRPVKNLNISPMLPTSGGYEGYTGYGTKDEELARMMQKEASAVGVGPEAVGAPNYDAMDRNAGLYQDMMARGMDASPTNFTGGLARLANAYLGRRGMNKLEDREREAQEYEASAAQAQKDKLTEMARMMAGPDATPEALTMAEMFPEEFAKSRFEMDVNAAKPVTPQKPSYYETTVMENGKPMQYELQHGNPDYKRLIGEAEPTSALVEIQNGETQKKLGEYEPETIIPWELTGQDKQPEGYVAVRDPNARYGYRIEPFANSEAAAELISNETRLNNSTAVTRSLINSYGTLARNKAIPTLSGSRGDQIAGAFGSTFIGKGIDASGFGNMENDAARGQIDGISMNSLMQMVSMSDVSARAMDSDAEMRAWLGAIKGDVYEEALVKLHVLDMSFGSGMALDLALEAGEIGQDEYDYVMKQMGTGVVQSKLAKARQYASLEGEGKLYDGRDLSEERGKPLVAAPAHSGRAKRKRFNPATGRVE